MEKQYPHYGTSEATYVTSPERPKGSRTLISDPLRQKLQKEKETRHTTEWGTGTRRATSQFKTTICVQKNMKGLCVQKRKACACGRLMKVWGWVKNKKIKEHIFTLFSPPILSHKLHECAHTPTLYIHVVPLSPKFPREENYTSDVISQRGGRFLHGVKHTTSQARANYPSRTLRYLIGKKNQKTFHFSCDLTWLIHHNPHPPCISLLLSLTDQDSYQTDRQGCISLVKKPFEHLAVALSVPTRASFSPPSWRHHRISELTGFM